MSGWICRNYGRKQGLFRSLYHSLMDGAGRYTRHGTVDWGQVERLVFVCQGNICTALTRRPAPALGIAAIRSGSAHEGGTAPAVDAPVGGGDGAGLVGPSFAVRRGDDL